MEITWADGSHSTGRFSMTAWKSNTAIKLLPVLAQGEVAGPWVVKFDIDPAAGNEIANAQIGFNLVFDGVQAGGSLGAVCGNGVIESGEQCDDGNISAGDGCSATCEAESPSAEVCDGKDNDLNGIIDDGNPGGGASCSIGLPGICAAGTMQCQGGSVICVQNILPSAEVCDGLDNNCDGQADEGNPGGGAACSTGSLGVCAAGTTQCQNGFVGCVQNMASTAEICDGLDNDCNGFVDDNCSQ